MYLKKDILNFIEDKEVDRNEEWYLHATKTDIEIIKKILNEGITSAYLRSTKGNHFNGPYYISVFKNDNSAESLNLWAVNSPKFVISDISPFHADRTKLKFRRIFINTPIPLRTSEWDGEYHQYMRIDPSKIVALEYSLSYILFNSNNVDIKEQIEFLREMILCMKKVNKDLPIYDLSSNHEFNKQKILSLNL